MAKCDAVIPLMAAMKRRGDAIHVAAETIKKMYDLNIPELVAQVSTRCLLPVSPASEIMKHVLLLLAYWRAKDHDLHTQCMLFSEKTFVRIRVSYRGGGGVGWNSPPPPPPPPPPQILKLCMVIIVLSQVLNNNLVPDCVRSNLRGSVGEGHAPRPP